MATIYQLKHSPFCIPVVALFRSLGLPLDEVNVSNGSRAEIIRLTQGAYYQVPVLVDGQSVIFESGPETQDVARYIDRKYALGKLFPADLDGLQALVIKDLEENVEGVTFRLADIHYVPAIEELVERVMVIRHKERKFGRGCVDAWRRDQGSLRSTAEGLLAPYDQALASKPFLFGDHPAYADFLLYGILGNYTFNGWNTLPDELGNLRKLMERIESYRFDA